MIIAGMFFLASGGYNIGNIFGQKWETCDLPVEIKMDEYSKQSSGTNRYVVELTAPVGASAMAQQEAIIQDVYALGGTVDARIVYTSNALVVTMNAQNVSKLAESPYVKRVYLDRNVVKAFDIVPVGSIVIPKEFETYDNLTGKGVVVAIVDTGIDDSIPELSGKVIDVFSISGEKYVHWHGTACAGVVIQVAPDVKMINVMVFQPDGSAYLSDILKGLDYVAMWHMKHPNTPLICSNSWGISQENWQCGGWRDPCIVCEAVNRMSYEGIIMVVAAGNDGYIKNAINCPGQAEHCITVGAVDSNYNWVWFSSVGPTVDGNRKPDVVAIGYNVETYDVGGGTRIASGTSFSTPAIAGVFAKMAEKYGTKYSPEQYYKALRESCIDLDEEGYDYKTGYGLPNVSMGLKVIEGYYPEQYEKYIGVALTLFGFLLVGISFMRKERRIK